MRIKNVHYYYYKRAVKRKAQGVANRVIDRAAGHLTKRAKRGVADLLGV